MAKFDGIYSAIRRFVNNISTEILRIRKMGRNNFCFPHDEYARSILAFVCAS